MSNFFYVGLQRQHPMYFTEQWLRFPSASY